MRPGRSVDFVGLLSPAASSPPGFPARPGRNSTRRFSRRSGSTPRLGWTASNPPTGRLEPATGKRQARRRKVSNPKSSRSPSPARASPACWRWRRCCGRSPRLGSVMRGGGLELWRRADAVSRLSRSRSVALFGSGPRARARAIPSRDAVSVERRGGSESFAAADCSSSKKGRAAATLSPGQASRLHDRAHRRRGDHRRGWSRAPSGDRPRLRPLFSLAILRALAESTWEPARQDGHPVESSLRTTVAFKLPQCGLAVH